MTTMQSDGDSVSAGILSQLSGFPNPKNAQAGAEAAEPWFFATLRCLDRLLG